MPLLLDEDYKRSLPKMYAVKQNFNGNSIVDIENAVTTELLRGDITKKIKAGQKVAIAVGSRGISNLELIVKTLITYLKSMGANPFILSAMGSHGNGTEAGQREVLTGYGVTEKTMGVPVVTTVDSILLGNTSRGVPVYFDRCAYEADVIIPVNRIKLHTDFSGPIQSGLCKMLVIGLGNQIGCSAIHEVPPEYFSEIIEEAAEIIMKTTKVGFGLAIIENGYDQTSLIEAIPSEHILVREKELVEIAKEYMPCLEIKDIDVLIVEEIGKDVSGAGFDPNIIGHSSCRDSYTLPIPNIQKMVLLNITDASHGNGIGMGLFDIITKKCFQKLDLEAMYANAIACKCIDDCKIPLMAETEEEAIRIALKVCRNIDKENPKIVKIKNTLKLENIEVSEEVYRSFLKQKAVTEQQ